MKIIDLLNRIAKGEEVPKKISINGGIHGIDVWEYDENCKDYISSSDVLLLYSGMTSNHLTDEVEVLEEVEDKEYEDIEEINYYPIRKNEIAVDYIENDETKHFCLNKKEKYFADKINALIRNQQKIIEVLNDNNKNS